MEGDSEFFCPRCGHDVREDDDFCPHCGAIFSENVFCARHEQDEAEGVCVVCGTPCCDRCGENVNGMFLCAAHSECEIFEGMVRVLGTHNEAEARSAAARLVEAGLHPELFYLQRFSGVKAASYEVYRDGDSYEPGELKVMVPCDEVENALKIIPNPGSPSSHD